MVLLEVISVAVPSYNLFLYMERGVPANVLRVQLSIATINAFVVALNLLVPVSITSVFVEEIGDMMYVFLPVS